MDPPSSCTTHNIVRVVQLLLSISILSTAAFLLHYRVQAHANTNNEALVLVIAGAVAFLYSLWVLLSYRRVHSLSYEARQSRGRLRSRQQQRERQQAGQQALEMQQPKQTPPPPPPPLQAPSSEHQVIELDQLKEVQSGPTSTATATAAPSYNPPPRSFSPTPSPSLTSTRRPSRFCGILPAGASDIYGPEYQEFPVWRTYLHAFCVLVVMGLLFAGAAVSFVQSKKGVPCATLKTGQDLGEGYMPIGKSRLSQDLSGPIPDLGTPLVARSDFSTLPLAPRDLQSQQQQQQQQQQHATTDNLVSMKQLLQYEPDKTYAPDDMCENVYMDLDLACGVMSCVAVILWALDFYYVVRVIVRRSRLGTKGTAGEGFQTTAGFGTDQNQQQQLQYADSIPRSSRRSFGSYADRTEYDNDADDADDYDNWMRNSSGGRRMSGTSQDRFTDEGRPLSVAPSSELPTVEEHIIPMPTFDTKDQSAVLLPSAKTLPEPPLAPISTTTTTVPIDSYASPSPVSSERRPRSRHRSRRRHSPDRPHTCSRSRSRPGSQQRDLSVDSSGDHLFEPVSLDYQESAQQDAAAAADAAAQAITVTVEEAPGDRGDDSAEALHIQIPRTRPTCYAFDSTGGSFQPTFVNAAARLQQHQSSSSFVSGQSTPRARSRSTSRTRTPIASSPTITTTVVAAKNNSSPGSNTTPTGAGGSTAQNASVDQLRGRVEKGPYDYVLSKKLPPNLKLNTRSRSYAHTSSLSPSSSSSSPSSLQSALPPLPPPSLSSSFSHLYDTTPPASPREAAVSDATSTSSTSTVSPKLQPNVTSAKRSSLSSRRSINNSRNSNINNNNNKSLSALHTNSTTGSLKIDTSLRAPPLATTSSSSPSPHSPWTLPIVGASTAAGAAAAAAAAAASGPRSSLLPRTGASGSGQYSPLEHPRSAGAGTGRPSRPPFDRNSSRTSLNSLQYRGDF
ncbi:hypothetical protein DFQ26_007929 [Actinomortierella ambigua]|nr:hypothetical protein DFQ26_007929 [Actinomortierella ambigua]